MITKMIDIYIRNDRQKSDKDDTNDSGKEINDPRNENNCDNDN